MPRLINDIRRKQTFVSLLILTGTVAIGILLCRSYRQMEKKYRDEVERLINELQETNSRYFAVSPSAFDHDITDINNFSQTAIECCEKPLSVSNTVIDSFARTRSNASGNEVRQLVEKYNNIVDAYKTAQVELGKSVDSGKELVGNISSYIESDLAKTAVTSIEQSEHNQNLLKNDLNRNYLLKLLLGDTSKNIITVKSNIDKLQNGLNDYGHILKLLDNSHSLTNRLSNDIEKLKELDFAAQQTLIELKALPFDTTGSFSSATNCLTTLSSDCETIVSYMRTARSKFKREFDDDYSKTQKDIGKFVVKMEELQTQHGSYFKQEKLELARTVKNKLNEQFDLDFETFQKNINLLVSEETRLNSYREQAKVFLDNILSGSRNDIAVLESNCRKVIDFVRQFDTVNLTNLVKVTEQFVNDVQVAVLKQKNAVETYLHESEAALPNWAQKKDEIISKRQEILKDLFCITNKVADAKEKLSLYRDGNNNDKIVALRTALLKKNEDVGNLAREFELQIKCSNGREANAAETINLELLEKVNGIKATYESWQNDFVTIIRSGEIYRVEYEPCQLQLGEQLSQGTKRIDFSLDINKAGRHNVAVRVYKTARKFLYDQNKKHSIEFRTIMSDDYGNRKEDSVEHSDTTASWGKEGVEIINLSGDYPQGKVDFILHFGFSTSRDNPKGEGWRFNLLHFEIYLDGQKVENFYRKKRL